MTGFLNTEVSQITQRGRTGLVLKDIGEVRRGKFNFAGNIRQTDFLIQVFLHEMNGTLHHVSFFLHTRKTALTVFSQKLHGTQKVEKARRGIQHVVLVIPRTDRSINFFKQQQTFFDTGMFCR